MAYNYGLFVCHHVHLDLSSTPFGSSDASVYKEMELLNIKGHVELWTLVCTLTTSLVPAALSTNLPLK